VRPALYSYGSATIGTVQQLAGATGTALFIALLTIQAVGLSDSGSSALLAQAGGVRAAFTVGAVISLLAIIVAFFVTRPADDQDAAADGVDTPAEQAVRPVK